MAVDLLPRAVFFFLLEDCSGSFASGALWRGASAVARVGSRGDAFEDKAVAGLVVPGSPSLLCFRFSELGAVADEESAMSMPHRGSHLASVESDDVCVGSRKREVT